jgi:choline dehydrogenase-like flavoprotein
MILNSSDIKNNQILNADICLIGSGPAILTLLEHLNIKKLKIILIPGGKFHYDKKNQKLYKGILAKNVNHEPLINNRHREFGGSGNYWGGRCVPFDEIDFKKRKWIKHSGWPLKLRDLSSYYNKASRYLKISKYNKDTNFYIKGLNPMIKNLDDKKLTSKKLESWSPVLNFKKKLKKKIFSENIILINNSHLIKIDANDKKVNNILCKVQDKKFNVLSKKYVLGCGGIENPRILLYSKNNYHPRGLGNAANLVGRFYMAHHSGISLNLNPKDRKNIFYNYFKDSKGGAYLRNRLWFRENFQKKNKVGNSIFFLNYTLNSKDMGAQGKLFEMLILYKKIISNKKNLCNFNIISKLISGLCNIHNLKYFIKFIFFRLKKNRLPSLLPGELSKYFGLYYQIEHTPCYYSRLTLDKKKDAFGVNMIKLNLKFNKVDLKTIFKTHSYLMDKMNTLKIVDFQKNYTSDKLLRMLKKKIKKFNSNAHHIGTTRMSFLKKYGVVDKNLKVFGINNLFIVGSSTFPTSSHANPTYTIVALSIKLSDYLNKFFMKKNKKN